MTFTLLPRPCGARIAATAIACASGALALGAATATAAVAVPPGFAVTQFAAGTGTSSRPDDIVRLDGHIFVGYQNGVGADGSASTTGVTTSTVVEYNHAGKVLGEWTPTGRVDGIGADPLRHLVYMTVNEDANSSFYVLDPGAAPPSQLRHLSYSDPDGAITGGTDAVSVDPFGTIYISASNPADAGSTAVAIAKLDSPSAGQVALTRTFADNAAGVANGNGSGTVTLALTDPDSNAIVPSTSPRFANSFVLDSQGDGQLVFGPSGFGPLTNPSRLTQLSLSVPGATTQPVLDDVRWARADGGTMYVVDQGGNAVYRITGPFRAGQAFGSQPTDPSIPPLQSDVVNIDLENGAESAFATGFKSPKGLLYVGPSDDPGFGSRLGP